MPDDNASEYSLEGVDSSVPANTLFANEFIEVAAERTTSHPGISAALNSLRQIVSIHKTQTTSSLAYRFPKQKDVSPGGLSQLPMPPLAATMAEIEDIKGSVPPLPSPPFLPKYVHMV
jgi:hypothetical protein